MPIVVITGLPASGKTVRARELQHYLVGRGKTVHLISENETVAKAQYEKNDFFNDPQKEKIVRSQLKSEAARQINKDDVVILDAGNYIKGYRYELFCMVKAARTTQCTLFTCIPEDQAWTFNLNRGEEPLNQQLPNNSHIPYTRETFDALCMRYEEPQSSSRWDNPLVAVLPEDTLDLEAIFKTLYETQPLPANKSTQNPPLGPTNYLFDMDVILQGIIKEILGAAKIGAYGQIKIKDSTIAVKVTKSNTAIQLNRLRQKFITSTCRASQTTPAPLEQVAQLFVQFINANTYGYV